MVVPAGPAAARGGRPSATSREELERLALALFAERGFDATTVDDLARAAGVGRRTFFRYYPSKNDVVWGDFDAQLTGLADALAATPSEVGLADALRLAIVDFNSVPVEELPFHRVRMSLILRVPALQAHSTLRYAQWRAVVAAFAGERLGERPDALRPQVIGHATLGAAVAAYERWLSGDGRPHTELLDAAVRQLAPTLAQTHPPA